MANISRFTNLEEGNYDYIESGKKYPNPFFDLAGWALPKNIKSIFKYCRGFFYTNGFIRNIISKLTEYPITEILYDQDYPAEVSKKYDKIFRHNLKIQELLISIGLDYYTYGNCFVSANLGFKRYLKCKHCGHSNPIKKVKWKWSNFTFTGACPKCKKTNTPFTIEDIPINNADALTFIRWSPENIDVEFDEISGQIDYYYKIPVKKKKQITGGVKGVVEKCPQIFLKAMRDKKTIKLDTNNLYHFKRPTLAEEDRGWGKPIILPALKEIYYMQTLKRGNEAISLEHVVPKKAIFPQAGGAIDPYTQMNLGSWSGKIEDQVRKWRRDPNHIGVFPIPIGYQELGGDAKSLLITNELRFIEENIINSVGLPMEFIKGGASWTGSSVSLRIVENHFVPYREMLSDFMNYFLIEKVSQLLKLPPINVKFKKLRMTDDSESKQLITNLNANRKVSDETLLDEFGVNAEQERELLKKDLAFNLEMNSRNAEETAEAQGKGQLIAAKYQARANQSIQEEMHKQRERHFEDDIAQENANVQIESSEILDKLAIRLSLMPEEQRQASLNDLAQRAPVTAGFVLERFLAKGNQMQAAPPEGGGGNQDNVKEGDKVKPGPDKKKGPTKGQP